MASLFWPEEQLPERRRFAPPGPALRPPTARRRGEPDAAWFDDEWPEQRRRYAPLHPGPRIWPYRRRALDWDAFTGETAWSAGQRRRFAHPSPPVPGGPAVPFSPAARLAAQLHVEPDWPQPWRVYAPSAPPDPDDDGKSASFTITVAGLAAGGVFGFTGTGDDPFGEVDFALDASGDLF
ncbi:MAG: hypothetical protein ACRED8_09445, partial [Caulobacteraceae bacterium]